MYGVAEVVVLDGELGFPLDDSWIHLQFARNLAAGEGLSYNPGEMVTGSTAPLWTALLSLLFLLPGNVVLWVKALGTACYLGTVHASFRLARELELSRALAALAAVLTLATGWLVWSALSGMEVNLFALLTLWGTILHLRERRSQGPKQRPPLSLPVLALAVLARPEGALLLLLALADRLLVLRRTSESQALAPAWPAWRRPALGLALGLAGLAGTLVFYAWAGGSLLPTTFSVKGSGLLRWLPEPLYLREIWGIFFVPHPWMTLLAPAGCLVLIERLGTTRDRGLLPALWVAGMPLAYSLMSPLGRSMIAGNFGRYYFPLFPFVIVLGTLGLERVAAALSSTRLAFGLDDRRRALPVTVLLALLLLWPTAAAFFHLAPFYAGNVADVHDSDVRMARFLARRLPPEALLAVNDIGAFKYFLPNRILDVVGIASPEARRFRERRIAEGATFHQAVVEHLAEHQPDYIAIFPSWLPPLATDPRFPPLYVLEIGENRTMGGDRIVLFGTPWTRYSLADAERLPGDPIPIQQPSQQPGAPDADNDDADPADRPLPR